VTPARPLFVFSFRSDFLPPLFSPHQPTLFLPCDPILYFLRKYFSFTLVRLWFTPSLPRTSLSHSLRFFLPFHPTFFCLRRSDLMSPVLVLWVGTDSVPSTFYAATRGAGTTYSFPSPHQDPSPSGTTSVGTVFPKRLAPSRLQATFFVRLIFFFLLIPGSAQSRVYTGYVAIPPPFPLSSLNLHLTSLGRLSSSSSVHPPTLARF